MSDEHSPAAAGYACLAALLALLALGVLALGVGAHFVWGG
jgi:hypothetical protein